MYNTSDQNPINTNRILKEIQKEIRDMQSSIREIFKEVRNRKKGESINKYLSVTEVADLLQVHPATVYRMTYSGRLPTTRIKRKLYIHEDDVVKALGNSPT